MSRLKFEITQVRKVIAEAKADGGTPTILFVHDEGVYIMALGAGKERTICYAQGYDPTKEDRMKVWDKCRDAVGGDDFCERLSVHTVEKLTLGDTIEWFTISMSASHLSLGSIGKLTLKDTPEAITCAVKVELFGLDSDDKFTKLLKTWNVVHRVFGCDAKTAKHYANQCAKMLHGSARGLHQFNQARWHHIHGYTWVLAAAGIPQRVIKVTFTDAPIAQEVK
jgi:hypothetical protein